MEYFSDQEIGERPRDAEEISVTAWGGIRALIQSHVHNGSFGDTYRESCFDGPVAIGTDAAAFRDAMRSQIPGLPLWPWRDDNGSWDDRPEPPNTLQILDMIQFCWKYIAKPIPFEYHSFGKHDHLHFNVEGGRQEFRAEIELIFRRNGIAFTLTDKGRVERFIPTEFRRTFADLESSTSELELDQLLQKAMQKFLDPDPAIRQEALQDLWDAFERLKTLDGPGDKAALASDMLDTAAGPNSPKFREQLDSETKALTSIGNNLGIRHSETSQEPLASSEHVDYLFFRLASLIRLVIRSRASQEAAPP